MLSTSPISKISRLGLSSFQREKLGLEAVKNKLGETTRKLKRASEFRAALDILLDSNIDFWVLKGIELSQRNYGDPMARTFGDLDILVPDKVKVGQLRTYLLERGWLDKFPDEWIEDQPRRDWYMDLRHHISLIDPVHQISVELHWQLDYRFLKLPENKLQEILGSETDDMEILGRTVKVLKPELEYVFLLSHATRHGWSYLKWLVDMHHFPKSQIDSTKLQYWIDFFRLSRPYHLFLALESKYLEGETFPSTHIPSYLVNYCSYRMELPEHHLPVSLYSSYRSFKYDMLLSRDWRDFLAIVDLTLIRFPDIFETKLPFRFLYYFYRPLGILLRRKKDVSRPN